MSDVSWGQSALPTVRRLLLALLSFGMAATGIDLLLLEHFEEPLMVAPLALVGVGLLVVGWHVARPSAANVRVLQAVMALFVVAGGVGVVLHYRGNMGFQLDMNPDIGNWDLFSRVMRAKAPPALAPGAMAQLGLLGLIYAFRHPAAVARTSKSSKSLSSSGA
mgnify:CR=1 FL=1